MAHGYYQGMASPSIPKTIEVAPEPTFNRACRVRLESALAVQAQRGTEYGDSWSTDNMNPIYLKALLLKEFGLVSVDGERLLEQLRLVMLAALIDVKDSRVANGDIKEDSVDDGINYRAVFIQLLKEYREKYDDIPF